MEKEDIVSAFTNANRNRYFKLFDYYEGWFTNKDYLSVELCRKIKADLDIQISQYSIHYIRSKIMPKRLADKAVESALTNNKKSTYPPNLGEIKTNNTFEFSEPKSIDHNQEIVTFRKSKNETD
jgi:hypothetical protein